MRARQNPIKQTGRAGTGAQVAEFGPVLFVLFIVILIPFLALLSFLDGLAVVTWAVNQAARAAGPAQSRSAAQAAVAAVGDQILGGPLGAFARVTPRDHTGLKLVVLQIPSTSGGASEFPPGATPDTTHNFYEYQVTGTYLINPLFLPQLFKSPVTFTSSAACENPNGLSH